MRIALVQMTSSDDPRENLEATTAFVAEAAAEGVEFVLTPEVTNCVSLDRARQGDVLTTEAQDITLEKLSAEAARLRLWMLIGSLALRAEHDDMFVNRSFLIDPNGTVRARYDKIHMFDVDIASGESFRESNAYRAGTRAVLADAAGARVGMTICYDLRFPGLYRSLSLGGADVLTVPSAFSPTTGAAHWEPLLRARAIENGAFVVAPAQTGSHPARIGERRETWGHSMVVDPWGRVLADAGTEPGLTLVDIDLALVEQCRSRIPSLRNGRDFEGP